MTVEIGSRVYVDDPGLAQLRRIMQEAGADPPPNHHGTITRDHGDSWAVLFDDSGSVAPYPKDQVHPLEAA